MADDFNDIDLSQFGAGALSGAGADDHYASRSRYVPEGVRFEIVCDTCGQRQYVLVSWDECIFVSQGHPPPGNPQSPAWGYSARHGALHPNIPCCSCQRKDTLVMMTPDEAHRHIRAGIQAGHLQSGYVANAVGQIQGMQQHYRR